ncbi:MAG: hypothetical protein GY881_09470, partial [Gammaproteobacteria bacterium]|nr:hypothetical protein [Gammaproteobacteria bacterium]
MLIPRMTTAQRTAISNPATGLLVFDKTIGGFWFYDGSSWNSVDGEGWIISGTDMYSAVSGNVGIGRTTPPHILSLKKPGASDMTYVRFESGANTNGIDIGARGGGSLGIIQRDAFSIDFFTDETQRMQITADGNVGIGATAPESSAQLEVKSTDKGFLPPRMTQAQRDGISSPAAGLLVYQTDETPGYYYYTGTDWNGITGAGAGPISTSSLIDSDGNTYPTITIGNQVWMLENLRVTHYRNGDAIPNVTDDTGWSGLSTGAYCWYDNDQATNEKYGALYNWYTVDDSRGLCPEGWH